MRSWLAQSLRTLEDMVDSGELTEEELVALAKSALVPNIATLSTPPMPMPEPEDTPDQTGVHATQSAITRTSKRTGTE